MYIFRKNDVANQTVVTTTLITQQPLSSSSIYLLFPLVEKDWRAAVDNNHRTNTIRRTRLPAEVHRFSVIVARWHLLFFKISWTHVPLENSGFGETVCSRS